MNNNLDILRLNICNSLWHQDEDVHNEACRLFLKYCEKDVYPYYKAEKFARLWINIRDLLKITEQIDCYKNAPNKEIQDFFMARMPNAAAA
jgi:hypothetical protein